MNTKTLITRITLIILLILTNPITLITRNIVLYAQPPDPSSYHPNRLSGKQMGTMFITDAHPMVHVCAKCHEAYCTECRNINFCASCNEGNKCMRAHTCTPAHT
jgi:hypothetical protein